MLICMRHSVRLDSDGTKIWDDKDDRPYDTPIIDFDLPVQQAALVRHHNISIVVVSPFRRCLQTAGIICRELGIESITVDFGLSESVDAIRRCMRSGNEVLTFLSKSNMQIALGEGVVIADVQGTPSDININESLSRSSDRYFDTFLKWHDISKRSLAATESVLFVSHGHGVETFAGRCMSSSREIYCIEECGFLVVDRDSKVLVESSRAGFITD